MFLTDQELIELTGKVKPTAQSRVLDFMEIPYKSRPDGTLAVVRYQFEAKKKEPASPRLRLSVAR